MNATLRKLLLGAGSIYALWALSGAVGAVEADIPAYTPALAARLEVHPFPLIAAYRRGDLLLFVAAGGHVFTGDNNRTKSIAAAFDEAKPAILILEGFPTSMGEDPLPLVAEAKKRGDAHADSYARGEPMFAASLALDHNIPFIGGEPTVGQQEQALMAAGYAPDDVSFTFLLLDIAQAIRSKQLMSATDPKLPDFFGQMSRANARDLKTRPMTLAEFTSRYRVVFGLDFHRDMAITRRVDPGTATLVGKLFQADMVVRDRHIFATIMDKLKTKKRVLVVYGGSHWTTLSQALEHALGKPTFR
jgi:hypothetical protein